MGKVAKSEKVEKLGKSWEKREKLTKSGEFFNKMAGGRLFR